jgi:hypothetical protein
LCGDGMTDLGSAIVATTGAVVGAAVGAAATYWTTKRSIVSAERIEDKRLQHDREMAHEARTQQRRGDTYVELLRFLNWFSQFLSAEVDLENPGREPLSVEPTQEERDQLLARVHAFGSVEVRTLLDTVMLTHLPALAAQQAVLDSASVEGSPAVGFEGVRSAVLEIQQVIAAIRTQAWRELHLDEPSRESR